MTDSADPVSAKETEKENAAQRILKWQTSQDLEEKAAIVESLYEENKTLFVRIFMAKEKVSKDDALDAYHAAFLQFLEKLPGFQPRGPSILPWLLTVAWNDRKDTARRNQRYPTTSLDALRSSKKEQGRNFAFSDPEQKLELREGVQEILGLLTDEQRQAFVLKYGYDLNSREAGEMLRVKPTRFRQWVRRGWETLRSEGVCP